MSTTATLSGPTSGLAGVASADFTITLDSAAAVSESFPITYAGGSITTSPVVIGIGQTTGTFTVTPSSVGASNVSLGAGTTGLSIDGSPIAYQAWAYHAAMTDANGTSLASFPSQLKLTTSNFPFVQALVTGADLRVYDATAAAFVPIWLQDFAVNAFPEDPNSPGKGATLWYLATNTGHTHQLWWGNPSASAVSSFASVFTHGSGFDVPGTNAGWGDLTTATAGATAAATVYPSPASASDPRNVEIWRHAGSSMISVATAGFPTGGGVYTGLREFSLLGDVSNKIIPGPGGSYWAAFARRPNVNTSTIDAWSCTGPSPQGPWSDFTQLWTTGTEHVNYPNCTILVGSTYYCFLTFGWANGGGTTPGMSIYVRTSTDLVSWSAATQVLTAGGFNDQTSGACTDISNAWVITCQDGVYMMTVEGCNLANGKWACFGATSTDLATWTPLNSGNALIAKGTGVQWDFDGAANPKCFQQPDGSYLIGYNGSDDAVNGDWQIGWATASSRGGPYTKSTANPTVGNTTGTYGEELSHFSYDIDGINLYFLSQRYVTTSSTGAIWQLYAEPFQGGLLLSQNAAGTDAATAGLILGGGNFTVESRAVFTAQRTYSSDTLCWLELIDSATVATGASTTLNPLRAIQIQCNGLDRASPGSFYLFYYDTGGTRNSWTGSAWSGTATLVAADYSREVVARIGFDGTTYFLGISYADTGASIASANIAASSVLSMSAGKCLLVGDPLTDYWCGSIFARQIDVRPYAAVEPAMSIAAMTVLAYPAAMMMGL